MNAHKPIDADEQLKSPHLELAARADAGQKLALMALEFLASYAKTTGTRFDFEGAAEAMESDPVLRTLDGEALEIELRSRSICADMLRRFGTELYR
ncbi:MAG: hypothetical protein A4S12_02650 [Proteobacteria bacterium SG_bin5]|nr:hypothetical protein [Sphingomonas sp.]OQW39319.1 MAG: hypothetical protein A4S12_02650 [Proteobacteria bacterium SG_bin5]